MTLLYLLAVTAAALALSRIAAWNTRRTIERKALEHTQWVWERSQDQR